MIGIEIGVIVVDAKESAKIDTSNKSASAKIAEATSGVDVKEKPRTNFATASSGARVANGGIEGARKAFNFGKRAATRVATLRSLTIIPHRVWSIGELGIEVARFFISAFKCTNLKQ